MEGLWILAGAVILILLLGGFYRSGIKKRRLKVAGVPLSENERKILSLHIGLYDQMPEELRLEMEPKIRVFLDEIGFEPCGGLPEVTEEMRLVIAGLASLLILRSGYDDYGKLRSVLVYPDAYRASDQMTDGQVRLGESWQSGSVVLSWRSVASGAINPKDGHNVVIHEFAHQLDQADGAADGVPRLRTRRDYKEWSEAFRESYQQLCEDVEKGRKTVIDSYGATNGAEFFAVATETFFEKPRQLQDAHPKIYTELAQFYGLDPANW